MEIRKIKLSDAPAFRRFQGILLVEKEEGNDFIEIKNVEDFVAFV